jgi:hypothetical protein
MRSLIRLPALALAGALLAMPDPPAAAQPVEDDEGPCQVYCNALHALCVLFGGGALCKDMRDGCNFGCTIRAT